MKIIAVDFDGTLAHKHPDNIDGSYGANIKKPKIGISRWNIIDKIKEEQSKGTKIILWTCREGILLDEAVSWCSEKGIVFDAINENIPEINQREKKQWGISYKPRKVYATEYWDDKAVVI